MNHNLTGLIITFAFVFLIIGISTLVAKLNVGTNGEISRKIVHIGVANCWWISMYFFDSPLWASIAPAAFIILNFISVKRKIFKAMERETTSYGTVYYPISLMILSIVCFSGTTPLYTGAIAMSCMGYGDGFAAVIGSKFGKHKFTIPFLNTQKSVQGCATMLIVSFTATLAILHFHNIPHPLIPAVFIAIVAAALETLTPDGFDNLTVPIGTGLFTHLIL
jgi:phytol kinase